MNDEDQNEEHEPTTVETWVLGFGAGAVVLLLLLIAYTFGFDQGEQEGEPATAESTKEAAEKGSAEPEPADTADADGIGEELFAENCGSCHTLSAAGTTGTVGPDLDALQPDATQVQSAIENGGAGSGGMPANLVTGADAEAVAEYVASATGG